MLRLIGALSLVSLLASVPVASTFAEGLFRPSTSTFSRQSQSMPVGVTRSRTVTLDLSQAPGGFGRMSVGEPARINLNLFDDVTVNAVVKPRSTQLPFQSFSTLLTGAGNGVLVGGVEGDPLSVVSIARAGQDMFGIVATQGRFYRIAPLGGGEHRIDEIDPDSQRRETADVYMPQSGRISRQTADQPTKRPGEPVDIMILYATGSITALKKALDVPKLNHEVISSVLMAEMNESYVRSRIVEKNQEAFRLVYTSEISFERKDPIKILDGLEQGSAPDYREINALRDKYNADLVAIIVKSPTVSGTQQICGIAGSIPRSDMASGYVPARGYSVVDPICALVGLSFSHEIGHLMGAQHDPEAHGPKAKINGSNRGFIGYDVKLRTTMAYAKGCEARGLKCPRVPVFSNPQISVPLKDNGVNWVPGTREQYNAVRIKENLPYIAGYRVASVETKPAPPPQVKTPQPPAHASRPPAAAPQPPAPAPQPPAPQPPAAAPQPPAPKQPVAKPQPPAEKPKSGWQSIGG